MPAHVHDPGIGENQLKQAEMREIAPHLVGEERPPKLSMNAHGLKILFAKFLQRFRIEVFENGGIRRLVVCDRGLNLP